MEDEDLTSGPLEERLVSKKWNVRKFAYEELTKLFVEAEDEREPVFNKYAGIIKKIIQDNNVMAQEKGLPAVVAWVDRSPAAIKNASAVCEALIDKCISGRPATKQSSLEVYMLFVEREAQDAVFEALLEQGATHKVPKVVLAALEFVREIIHTFGASVVPLRLIIKHLASFFEHSDGKVRAEAQALAVEIYRWVGNGMRPALSNLRSAQMKTLEAEFQQCDSQPRPIPTRFLRSQQEKALQAQAAEAVAAAGPVEVDPFDIMEPQDILSQLGSEFWNGLASKKWKDRKDQLEKLQQLTNVPRLKSGDYLELVKMLKQIIAKDANVMVVANAADCLTGLVKGLRKEFAPLAKPIFGTLLAKLKEKKPLVTNAIESAMDALHVHCLPLAEVVDDLQAALEDKVPKVRAGALEFVVRALQLPPNRRVPLSKTAVKPLANLALLGLDDGTPEVRDAAAQAFGCLSAVAGERAMQPYLAKLDPVKAKKVKEASPAKPDVTAALTAAAAAAASTAAAPVSSSSSFSSSFAPSSATSTSTSSAAPESASGGSIRRPVTAASSSSSTSSSSAPSAAPARSAAASRPAAAAGGKSAAAAPSRSAASAGGSRGAAGGKGGKSSAASADSEGAAASILSMEEGVAQAASLLPEGMVGLLQSKNWKERLQGLQEMEPFVRSLAEQGQLSASSNVLVRQVEHSPSFKDSNVQVIAQGFQLVALIAQLDSQFSPGAANVVAPYCVQKIGEVKIRQSAADCLTAMAEAVGYPLVCHATFRALIGQKSPKPMTESLKWIEQSMAEFGIKGLDLRLVLELSKKALDNTNQQVRVATIAVLATLRRFVGPALRDQLLDLKASLLALIDKEFEAVAALEPPAPTRQLRGAAAVAAAASAAGGSGGLPREDISRFVTAELVAALKDPDWRKREEALQEVRAILQRAAKRIQPKLGPLLPALKERLNEKNRNIARLTLQVLAEVITAVGEPIDKQLKHFAADLFLCCGNNQKEVAAEAITTLDALAEQVPLRSLLEYLPAPLASEGSAARKNVLLWLNKRLTEESLPMNVDVKPLVKPALQCLLDRQGDVRQAGEKLMSELMYRTSYDVVMRSCKELKPSSMISIGPVLEQMRLTVANRSKSASSSSSSSSSGSSAAVSAGAGGSASGRGSGAGSSSQLPTAGQSASASAGQSARNVSSTDLTAARSKATSSSAAAVQVDSSLLRRNPDRKGLRELEERQNRWALNPPSRMNSEILSQQMQPCVHPSLLKLLFSRDSADHQKALAQLNSAVVDCPDATVDCLDMLLKWVTLRFFDNNPESSPVKDSAIGYLGRVVNVLTTKGYFLQDFEAQAFIPLLVFRMAQLTSGQRQGIRLLFRQMCKVYPSSKVLQFMLDGIATSEHPLSQLECLQQVRYLVARQSLVEETPAQVLNALQRASLFTVLEVDDREDDINDSDQERTIRSVHETAIDILAELYLRLREKVWGYLSPALGSLLKDAYKAKFDSKQPFYSSVESVAGKQSSESLPLPASVSVSVPSNGLARVLSGSVEAAAPPATLYSVPPSDIQDWMDELQSTDSIKIVNALKKFSAKLEEKAISPLYADLIIDALTQLMHRFFSGLSVVVPPDASRVCRYIISSMMIAFKRDFVPQVSLRVLKSVVEEVLVVLQESQVVYLQDGALLLQSLNQLTIKILDSSDRTNAFILLLQLLDETVSELITKRAASKKQPKFVEFVIKCLLKLAKTLRATIHTDIRLSPLLFEIHLFFEHQQAHFVKDSSITTDELFMQPFKTVKTVLKEIITLKGAEIYQFLDQIPSRKSTPMPLIHTYIEALIPPPPEVEEAQTALPVSSSAAAEESSEEPDQLRAKSELVSIFQRIQSSDESEQALQDLWAFQQKYPSVDLEPYLQTTSQAFRNFILQGLKKIERGQSASSFSSASAKSAYAAPVEEEEEVEQQQEVEEVALEEEEHYEEEPVQELQEEVEENEEAQALEDEEAEEDQQNEEVELEQEEEVEEEEEQPKPAQVEEKRPAVSAVSAAFQLENQPPVSSGADVTAAYKSKLAELQRRIGLKSTAAPAQSAPTLSAAPLRPLVPSSSSSSSSLASAVEGDAQAQPAATLEDIKRRLQNVSARSPLSQLSPQSNVPSVSAAATPKTPLGVRGPSAASVAVAVPAKPLAESAAPASTSLADLRERLARIKKQTNA